jgi:Stigma-specific protein, Stig1
VSQQTTNRSFDELARALASGTLSRGKALRLMGGLLVGGALGSLPGVAWADDDRCPQGQTRCGERCVTLRFNERHCGSCRNRCTSTQTCCNGRCVNLQRNERHCGRCFNRCAEAEQCVDGTCAAACISNGRGPCTTSDECCSGNCDSSGFCLPPTGPNRVDCFCGDGTQVSSCTSLSCSSSDADAIRSFVCNPLCASIGSFTDRVGCGAEACA